MMKGEVLIHYSPSTEALKTIGLGIVVYGQDASRLHHTWVALSDLVSSGFTVFITDSLSGGDDSNRITKVDQNGSVPIPLGEDQSVIKTIAEAFIADDWITFTHIADDIPASYFKELLQSITEHHQGVDLFISNHARAANSAGRIPRHALAVHHTFNAKIQLDREPSYFPYLFESATFRVGNLQEFTLEYHSTLDWDAGTISLWRYLLAITDPCVVFLKDPTYQVGPRPDPSAHDRVLFENPNRYSSLLSQGVLPVLETAAKELTLVPKWLQAAVAYMLTGYMMADDVIGGRQNAEMHGLSEEYHKNFQKARSYIHDSVINTTPALPLPPQRYYSLKYGYSDDEWVEDQVVVVDQTSNPNLLRLSYYFKGLTPTEAFWSNGFQIEPITAKNRAVVYAGKTLLYERVIWVQLTGVMRATLNGQETRITRRRPPRESAVLTVPRNQPRRSSRFTPRHVLSKLLSPSWVRDKSLRYLARVPFVKRYAGEAWILMDRVERANDNAEHLFRYLQDTRSDLNTWFALDRKSADWKRLKRSGVKNLLAYGSTKWKLIAANATHIISSQAGPYVYNPQSLHTVGVPPWKFIFLQHGVIHNNLSRWLNLRRFHKFVTTTYNEYAAIAGTGSTYRYTPLEVCLTGQPRHDRLNRLNLEHQHEARRWILVAPTWRDSLLGVKTTQKGDRLLLDDFLSSEYARRWRSFLSSEELRSAAAAQRLEIAFLPHPNIEPYLKLLDLPDWVQVLSYENIDVQETLVEAALMITDYSSVAFDAALISRPIIYYQFDLHEVFTGNLTGRQGYFSYVEDGFGPVCDDETSLVDLTREALEAGEMSRTYSDRVLAAFPFVNDVNNCARVVSAIEEDAQESGHDGPSSRVLDPPEAPSDLPTPLAYGAN